MSIAAESQVPVTFGSSLPSPRLGGIGKRPKTENKDGDQVTSTADGTEERHFNSFREEDRKFRNEE